MQVHIRDHVLRLCSLASLALFAALSSSTVWAQSPAASDIRDEAKLFSPDAVSKAKARLAQIDKTFQVPVIIESIESLQGEALNTAVIRLARQAGAQGMFILIPKREAKIETRVVAKLGTVFSQVDLQAVSDAFINQFRQREFDAGLEKGIDSIEKLMADAKAKGKLVPITTSSLIVRNQVRLTLDGARRVIAGAEAKAKELNLKVNIAVVDDGGHMMAFERMDGARPASGYTATTKAVAAATFRQATGPFPAGATQPDLLLNLSLQNAAAASGGKVTTLHGGVPVVVEGQVIAGVGVGGGTGEQDAAIARAGIESFLADIEGHGFLEHESPSAPK